jgi:hypothetical protein
LKPRVKIPGTNQELPFARVNSLRWPVLKPPNKISHNCSKYAPSKKRGSRKVFFFEVQAKAEKLKTRDL